MREKDGRSLLVIIAKYTFSVDPFGRVELDLEHGAEPCLVDEYNGDDPATSGIRRPSDLCDEVPGAQVLLVGHAHPPLRGSATSVDVSLSAGPISKTVRAYGLRAWQKGWLADVTPGPARPLRDPVPLVYELEWSPAPLRGDEPIEVRGATAEGVWLFALPRLSPGISSWVEGPRREHRTQARLRVSWGTASPGGAPGHEASRTARIGG
jgi:hypothetical protein